MYTFLHIKKELLHGNMIMAKIIIFLTLIFSGWSNAGSSSGASSGTCSPISVSGDYLTRTTLEYKPENVLTYSEEETKSPQPNYWLPNIADDDLTGELTFDLGCPKKINTVELVNTNHNKIRFRATKEFKLKAKTLDHGNNFREIIKSVMNNKTGIKQYYSFDTTEAQYLKFEVQSYWGVSAGLQFFNVSYFPGFLFFFPNLLFVTYFFAFKNVQ